MKIILAFGMCCLIFAMPALAQGAARWEVVPLNFNRPHNTDTSEAWRALLIDHVKKKAWLCRVNEAGVGSCHATKTSPGNFDYTVSGGQQIEPSTNYAAAGIWQLNRSTGDLRFCRPAVDDLVCTPPISHP